MLLSAACADRARIEPPPHEAARVAFATERVRVGDETLSPSMVTVEHARGAEQNWYFATRPAARGDLRVRVAVEGARFDAAREDGLLFAANDAPAARVLYTHGTWVDAAGVRTPIRARFERGAIELVVSEAVLGRTRFPAVLDPDILPLNGDAALDSAAQAADVAYPAFSRSSGSASIAVALQRGPAMPSVRVLAVDLARRSAAFDRSYASQDAVGLSSVALPVETFVLAHRTPSGASWGNLLLTWYPVSAASASLGFAPNDLPEFSCSAMGVCAFSYARVELPTFAVRRVFLGAGMGAPIVSAGNAVIGIGDAPTLGEHDVAVLGDTVVATWSHVDISTMSSVTEIARVPSSASAGMFTGRLLTVQGARARVACGAVECAVVVATDAQALAIARFGAGTASGPLTSTRLTLHAFTETVTAHDVAVIDGGYRVVYLVRGTSRARLVVLDLLASDSAPASINEFVLPAVATRSVRIASAPTGRVSLVTWVQGAGALSTAHGALITETPDASPIGDAAMVDAAVPEEDASTGDASASDASTGDASASDATTVDAAGDATPSDDVVASDAMSARDASSADAAQRGVQFGGGACACSTAPTRRSDDGALGLSAAWIASMATVLARRKRAR